MIQLIPRREDSVHMRAVVRIAAAEGSSFVNGSGRLRNRSRNVAPSTFSYQKCTQCCNALFFWQNFFSMKVSSQPTDTMF